MNVANTIARMLELKALISDMNDTITTYKKEYDGYEKDLKEHLYETNSTTAACPLGTVKLVDKVVPNIKSWDQFYAAIIERNALYLLERRPSVKACIEENVNDPLPGVEFITLTNLRLTKAK